MVTISLCMIVKNEQDVIGRCLESIYDIVDEIIIVDTGSTDDTKQIIQKYTDKIYDFEWIEDFSAARNYSFSKATMEYRMWLDADDVLLEKDRAQLLALKETLDKTTDVVMMKYDIAFSEDGEATFSYYRERLFSSRRNLQWVDPIHEVIVPEGVVVHSDIAVSHKKIHQNDPKRNLRIFEKMISEGIILKPRQKFYYARELYYNESYLEAISMFEDFLDSGEGWIENNISACLNLSSCYKALQQEEKAVSALLRSFTMDEPRAEICCDLGNYFFRKQQYKNAIFWYEIASSRNREDDNGGFTLIDCYGYIPYIQMCVCCDKLGDRKKAVYYNEKAGELKPGDPSVEYNKKYFARS